MGTYVRDMRSLLLRPKRILCMVDNLCPIGGLFGRKVLGVVAGGSGAVGVRKPVGGARGEVRGTSKKSIDDVNFYSWRPLRY